MPVIMAQNGRMIENMLPGIWDCPQIQRDAALMGQLLATTLRSRVLPPMRVREQARVVRTRGPMRMASV